MIDKKWIGTADEYKTKLRFALACEGMKRRAALHAAGWKSLRDYVDANERRCELGERELPYGYKPGDDDHERFDDRPAQLRNPSDHGDAEHAGIKEKMKNLQKELDRLQRQREQAKGRERHEVEQKMRPLQKELDGMKFRTRHWDKPRATVGGDQ